MSSNSVARTTASVFATCRQRSPFVSSEAVKHPRRFIVAPYLLILQKYGSLFLYNLGSHQSLQSITTQSQLNVSCQGKKLKRIVVPHCTRIWFKPTVLIPVAFVLIVTRNLVAVLRLSLVAFVLHLFNVWCFYFPKSSTTAQIHR